MKIIILILALSGLTVPAWAGSNNSCQGISNCNTTIIQKTYHKNIFKKEVTEVTEVNNTYVDQTENKNWDAGLKLDAPKLVELGKDWYLGTEVSKDFLRTDAGEGWGAYAKVTYEGTLFSFKK